MTDYQSNDNYSQAEFEDFSYKRLTSLFTLAESSVIKCLGQIHDEAIISRINEIKERWVKSYWLEITQNTKKVNKARISIALYYCLRSFYVDLFTFIPDTVRECIIKNKKNLIVFPKDAEVDWEELLYRFFAIEQSVEGLFFVPPHLIEAEQSMLFYKIARIMAQDEKPFDNTIMSQGIKYLLERLRIYTELTVEFYWELYDRPPLQYNMLKLKIIVSMLRFDINQLNRSSLPHSFSKHYWPELTKVEIIENLQNVLVSHELKEAQLLAQLNLDEYQKEPSISQITPSSIPRLIIPSIRQPALIKALTPYTITNIDDLKLLLKGDKPSTKIIFQGVAANSLAYLFRQANELEIEPIANNKKEIARWLVHWFSLKEKKGTRELIESTIYDALVKDKKPAKAKRIPYKP